MANTQHGKKTCRVDAKGNLIMKGGRHHLSFLDEVKPGGVISEVSEVQALTPQDFHQYSSVGIASDDFEMAHRPRRPSCGCALM